MDSGLFFDLVQGSLRIAELFRLRSGPDAFRQVIRIDLSLRVIQDVDDPVLVDLVQGAADGEVLRAGQHDAQHKDEERDAAQYAPFQRPPDLVHGAATPSPGCS